MKILYAIQGTGNGHLSRAIEIVPHLQKRAEVDVLISGKQWELNTPFPVKYRLNGMGFIFGKKGGVDILKTYLQMNSLQLTKEIRGLSVDEYDLVISDFEPVSAWACQLKKKVCVGLSNQVATLHPLAPKPESTDSIGKFILKHYAPTTHNYGFHFKRFDQSVFTPIIRKQVRDSKITDEGHITVYLPSIDDAMILRQLRNYKNIQFQIFSKHIRSSYRQQNFSVSPLSTEAFLKSMASSSGILCNAGFGTTSEALFLGKKLLVIPMKTQYEQVCNAAVLNSMGVQVIKSLKKKHHEVLTEWIKNGKAIDVDYPDETAQLLDLIISRHAGTSLDASNKDELKFLRRILQPSTGSILPAVS